MKNSVALTSLLALLLATGAAAPPPIPVAAASAVLARAHALCSADGGRLWGVSLCGPLMLADPQTHDAIANVQVPGAVRSGAYYRFTLPVDAPIANAPFEYDGIALIDRHFSTLTIAAPSTLVGSILHGTGWVLTLSAGTSIIPDRKEPGSYTVTLRHLAAPRS
ncbi:MAG: hypothetical protein WBW93_20885 [Steroidobacteraceae bacterium]